MKVKYILPDDEFERLIRCLNLTASNIDGEAFAAIRGANRVLDAHELTWEKVWPEIVERLRDEVRAEEENKCVSVPHALNELLTVLKPGTYRDLFESFSRQWREKGTLTERQREVLVKAWHQNNRDLYPQKGTWVVRVK